MYHLPFQMYQVLTEQIQWLWVTMGILFLVALGVVARMRHVKTILKKD
jgi:uncharacterized membrane protein